jgi:Ser/Thr protein kinase RdoA (MazF antagonist)
VTGQAHAAITQDFTPQNTRVLLTSVCRKAGLDPAGAELLRHQTNAVYRLAAAPVIVKIARPDDSAEQIQRAVGLTRWLTSLSFPTVPLLDIAQPVVAGGAAATFWRYLPQHRPVEAGDIARPLRQLHELPLPPVRLPALDAVAAIRRSLRKHKILSSGELDFMTERCDTLERKLPGISYDQPLRLIHADPQHHNTLWDGDIAVLADWDSAVIGPAEYDLVTIEIHCRRFAHPAQSYADFCAIYGRDIRDWPGYRVLCDVRELRMIATNARKSDPASPGAAEVHRRITQLQRADSDDPWAIL